MTNRLSDQLRPLTLSLALLAGGTLSVSAFADDGAAAGMDKPATPAQPSAKDAMKKDAPAGEKMAAKQEPTAKDAREQKAKDVEMLNDFVHYVLIDRADAAKAMAQGLMDRKFSPAEFSALVDGSAGYKRFSDAVSRAGRQPGLDALAAKLLKQYEGGKLSQARDPEAITANIKLLTGDMRQRAFARDRLIEAGEYAVPQLFSSYFDSSNQVLAAEVRRILVELGRHSVMPLVTALPKLNPTQQSQIASILGDMPQTQSLPFLYDLATNSKDASAKNAAENAIRRISGNVNTQMPLADRYNDLADAYYKGSPSLITFPNDPHQVVWEYQSNTGLTFQAVDTKVYPQTMAMKLSEHALKVDAASFRAVSTWVAANFSREIRSPEGYENPVYGKDRRDAMYYAVAAGPSVGQNVLGRALDASDTPLVRRALASVEKTGGRDLWKAAAGARRPLLDALRYPNRRVQYESAIAIGTAQPKDAFEGADAVVRTLGSSIRDASTKYALVVAGDAEKQASLAEVARKDGFTLLPSANKIDDIRQAIADAPGVDIVLANLPSQQTGELITQSQSDSRLRATPILAMVSAQGYQEQFPRFARDPRVRLLREGVAPDDVRAAAQALITDASGGTIAAPEAEQYKARSLAVLRDLAMSGSPILKVEEAQSPLVSAVAEAKGDTKYKIAEVLSLIGTKQAQVALFDAALNADPAERTKLLGLAANSAKRFGNMLEPRQVDALVDLTTKAKGEEATAAAAVVGALNLQGSGVVPLILGDKK